MKGKARSVSLARRLIIDLMHASVPLVVIERTMNLERLVKARNQLRVRPGWMPIVVKAFCIVARDEPCLRSFYLKWPWPRFYELPRSVAMAAIVRESFDPEAPILLKIGAADELPLSAAEAILQRGKNAPLDEVPWLDRILRITRLPLPLRRLIWTFGLNIGRQRANYFGTISVTSIANLGSETVVARAPGPNLISYGKVQSDHSMKLLFHWDHRIYDGITAARALQRLEDVLNNEIADELLAGGTLRSKSA
jgi:hypothetical protein